MTQDDSKTRSDGVELSEQATGGADGESEGAGPCGQHGSETVDSETRAEVLARDRHRCQVCGRRGPERGGLATLHVHHIERDPDDVDEDALENLTALCRSCHSWVHQQATPDEAPVTLTEADLSVLLPQDIEILRFLADDGPARTGDVADALTAELSVSAVRERLAVLMGLDNMVESRDRQIVDKDVETGVWGLTEQIEQSARGHIPTDPQVLLQRMEDEQVRQALDRGCDRHAIMDVLDISRRTTFYREKRAHAYDFPLEAFRRGGGRPPVDASEQSTGEADAPASDTDGHQRLATVPGDSEDKDARNDQPGDAGSECEEAARKDVAVDRDHAVIQEQLQTAIAALQRLNDEL